MARNPGRPPIINAPPLVTALALTFLAAHGARILLSEALQNVLLWHTALFPERFWGWVGASLPPGMAEPYSNIVAAIAPLFTIAFIHSDWVHVGLNAAMLLGVGKPVYENLQRVRGGESRRTAELFLFLFFLSVAGGSVAHLIANYPAGQVAVGASGGVSGLIAAVLLGQKGAEGRLLSRPFLTASVLFLVANLVLAFIGPAMLGAHIAWQAHAGGYVAGALVFRFLIWRLEGVEA
ncbi:MAG: rhomboid family intramembrane serine protease [Pseudomonadota bacterium]|uniref:rhomboid family intramembrane serine protease n=1 Tax=Hyphomonas sp. BRH_c22 TaxID=1629710 RepID=UPI000AE867F0|nr:rhomboid family intramembrane serine protease [Hyphomonas sp. BRH_c22]